MEVRRYIDNPLSRVLAVAAVAVGGVFLLESGHEADANKYHHPEYPTTTKPYDTTTTSTTESPTTTTTKAETPPEEQPKPEVVSPPQKPVDPTPPAAAFTH